MPEVLSQSEIDALLSAVATGSVETESNAAQAKQPDWMLYDLTTQERAFRGKLVGFQGIYERFARDYRVSLSELLKKNVTVTYNNLEFLKFGDYVANILLPTSINVFSVEPIHTKFLVIFTSKLTYALVDSYYGGSQRPFTKAASRDVFTAIEKKVLNHACSQAVSDLEVAWQPNFPLHFAYESMENNPSYIGSIHTSESVAVASFEVEFENLSGAFTIVVPIKSLDAIMTHLSVNVMAPFDPEELKWRKHWLSEVGRLSLDVKVELGSKRTSLESVKTWQVGTVITLERDAAEELPVLVEGQNKLSGLMGIYRGNQAIRLTKVL